MKVVNLLIEEHVLLRRFIGQLRWEEPDGDEPSARLRADLLAFFCALSRHEEFKETVFGGSAVAAAAAGPIPEAMSEGRRRLTDLRAEILGALKSERGSSRSGLKKLVDALADHLRAQFDWEEEQLWPFYRSTRNPEAELALEERASAQLALLAAEVAAGGVWLSDSSGRGTSPGERASPGSP